MSLINNTMVITPMKLKIRDLVVGYYWDTISDGKDIYGWNGKLKIQPKFQRNFVYEESRQEKLIISILKNFPINAIYFYQPKKGEEYYELLDGQQRIVSICNFYIGNLSINIGGDGKDKTCLPYKNIGNDLQKIFLDYELDINICNGSANDRIDWFKTINIGNEPLKDQEILNSNISPSDWLEDAKSYFSSTDGGGYKIGKHYISGEVKRQKYLETALKWRVTYENKINNTKKDIQEYMYSQQEKNNAKDLINFFETIIDWIKATFPLVSPLKNMDSVDWGRLYSEYHNKDPKFSREEIIKLLKYFPTVKDIKTIGVYEYLLTKNEKYLQPRKFEDADKERKLQEQGGICNICGKELLDINQAKGDHIKPFAEGGRTEYSNLQILCGYCNGEKGKKYFISKLDLNFLENKENRNG
ncbi:MAG: HNH endonuclease family protein [Mycoplasmoidaceae bacterium]